MNCVLCKNGTTEKGRVTITFEKDNAIVLIKNVPAEVCKNCGHYYLSDDTSEIVLQKAQEAVEAGAELEVIRLQVA